ncbi:MAG: ASCH domain-containing protein [Gemmataceae bacterium]
MKTYALSLKQPWATLLVHGLKTIEVRRWPTPRRGRILIHAARIPDERKQGWDALPAELCEQAKLVGGFIGAATLVDCRVYKNADDFNRDGACHLNAPDWWQGPVLYGFTFTAAELLPFRKYSGWMRFFPVLDAVPERASAQRRDL